MMSGLYDARSLDTYVSDFTSRFSTDGIGVSGGYGHRWASYFGIDQLAIIARRLREDPLDRRVVLSMWDPFIDLMHPDPKDIPCNTQVYFRIVDGALDMTVCCRSNDIIWGLYGSNIVCLSFMQEIMADTIGVKLGKYYHLSNNLHAYTDILEERMPVYTTSTTDFSSGICQPMDMVLSHSRVDGVRAVADKTGPYESHWMNDTYDPMMETHLAYKAMGVFPAMVKAEEITCPAWRAAALLWLEQREVKDGGR